MAPSADMDIDVSTSPATAEEVTQLESLMEIATQTEDPGSSVSKNAEIEKAIYRLAEVYSKNGDSNKLESLIKSTRPFLTRISKAKAGKLMRSIVDTYLDMDHDDPKVSMELCNDSIEWCKREKRTFLRQAIECRLIALCIKSKEYTDAINLINVLSRELKRLDDKALLVEVQLLESKAYHNLSNFPKARSSLTSARTAANAIYCPPRLQGALDLQSGILHAEENDYKTSYSYFYETFECYDAFDEVLAAKSLKYMLLCKIMLSLPDDVQNIVSGKLSLRYSGRHIDAMKAVANCLRHRSLKEFKETLATYEQELSEDAIVKSHLNELYGTMLEQNLCRLIEPFSRVEISHIASLINLPEDVVEDKLSKMILDQKFIGILDQGAGCLIVYEAPKADETYTAAIETINQMNKVVDSLYARAQKLS